MIIFLALKKNKLRINKFVALHFPTSRRKADQLIAEGKVIVNNNIAQLGVEVNPSDKIYVNGKLLKHNIIHEYYLFNKPKGYICSHKKQGDGKTLFELVQKDYLKFGGRLDKDSEGLMILSTDGDWLNQIFSPKSKIEKKYIVKINKPLQSLSKFRKKITFKGERLSLSTISRINDFTFEVSLNSGKNHEIRNIFYSNGFNVVGLKRVSIGNYQLKSISKGNLIKITI